MCPMGKYLPGYDTVGLRWLDLFEQIGYILSHIRANYGAVAYCNTFATLIPA